MASPRPTRTLRADTRPCRARNHKNTSGLALLMLLLSCGFGPLAPVSTCWADDARAELAAGAERVHRLSLEEILRRGVEASPKLWAQRYVIDQAEAQLGQARAGRLPRMEYWQIFGLVNAARGDALRSPDDREDLLNDLGPFTRLELRIDQPLYTFGKLKKHIDAAEKGLVAKQASLGRFKLELVVTLKELFYTLLLNEDLHRLISDTEEEFRKAVEKAEEMLEEDTMTQQELLKLRYGLARTRTRLLEIEKGRRLVHAALLRLLFLPPGEDFVLQETRLRPLKTEIAPLERYQEIARRRRPEWQQLQAGIDARQAELAAEIRQYYPDFFVTGMVRFGIAPNRDKQTNPFVVDDYNYFDGGAFLGVRMNLDFGLPQRIAEKRAELFTLLQEQREATSGMLLEIQKAYEETLETQGALRITRKARRTGRALAMLSAANFHMGLGGAQETFESFGIYAESAAEYYLAVKNYNMALAELARTIGVQSLENLPGEAGGSGVSPDPR